jgi:hypothetical protein
VICLPDDAIQLDMSMTGLVLVLGEFRTLTEMLQQAQPVPCDGDRVLAVGGPRHRILYCEQHEMMVIIFGRAVLRLRPLDFAAFIRLCGHARIALGPLPADLPQPAHLGQMEWSLN